MPKKIADPFLIPVRPPWVNLLTPAWVGTFTALAIGLCPSIIFEKPEEPPVQEWTREIIQAKVSTMFCCFFFGYIMTMAVERARWQAVRLLLNYHGWVFDQTCFKTKAWGLVLKFLLGPGPFSTYQFEDLLPPQPLPTIDETLNTFLHVAKPLVSPEDYTLTKQAAEEFRVNEGPKLQEHLQTKATSKHGWLADYWLMAAYLSNRESLAGSSNYFCATMLDTCFDLKDQLSVAAAYLHTVVKFHELIVAEKVQPFTLFGMVPLNMYGYKYAYNSVRIPDEYLDQMATYPESRHIIVIRKGHYFRMNVMAKDSRTQQMTLLSPEELRVQLERIVEQVDDLGEYELPLAALTGQKRNVWAKHREQLKKMNTDSLFAVESAMFHVAFDIDKKVKDSTQQGRSLQLGNGENRWFDKCFTVQFHDDQWVGWNMEHSFVDGTYYSVIADYVLYHRPKFENRELKKDPFNPPRDLSHPERLDWDLKGLETPIQEADRYLQTIGEDYNNFAANCSFGKDAIKKMRMSPDGFIQMMIQLAHYRMHGTIEKTYEPAMGRMFALGRTEMIHPVSEASVEFVKAADDPNVPAKKIKQLLVKAIEAQTQYRLHATVGYGCDRHLLGLYCAARELGMDVPQIFRDKVWQLPMKLSTSQTPLRFEDMGIPMDLTKVFGGFPAVCQEGYGVGYAIFNHTINVMVTSWKSGGTLGSERMANEIVQAMEDIRQACSAN